MVGKRKRNEKDCKDHHMGSRVLYANDHFVEYGDKLNMYTSNTIEQIL